MIIYGRERPWQRKDVVHCTCSEMENNSADGTCIKVAVEVSSSVSTSEFPADNFEDVVVKHVQCLESITTLFSD